MADVYTVAVDAIALSAATLKSLMELQTASTRKIILISWWVEFDGTSAAATPVKVELVRASAGITGTTITALKYTDSAPAAITTVKHSASGEGTPTDVLGIHRISPTTGIMVQYPLGREITVPVSGFLNLRCNAAATVNATVGMQWEE